MLGLGENGESDTFFLLHGEREEGLVAFCSSGTEAKPKPLQVKDCSAS